VITVITPTMPGREAMLAEACASVDGQTLAPYAHLVRCRAPRGAPNAVDDAEQRNALLAQVETEWLAQLDDDDLYFPHHLATIAPALDGADVVYTFSTTPEVAREDVTDWATADLVDVLRVGNCLPYCAAIRCEVLRGIGGWGGLFDRDCGVYIATGATADDWDLWIRLAEAGARFRCVPVETWWYRVRAEV
jgi:hypothetical protein